MKAPIAFGSRITLLFIGDKKGESAYMIMTDYVDLYNLQQHALDEIAKKYGLVIERQKLDKSEAGNNLVLFYTKEDSEHIESSYALKKPVWVFENSNEHGEIDYRYANHGTLDLSTARWKDVLEGHIRLALYKKLRYLHIAGSGGYLALREADSINNDLNREEIKALKQIYGAAYLVDVNYFGKKKERVLAGEESVFDEVTDEPVYNFAGSFCVPQKDRELERLILAWNRDDRIPKRGTDIDKIQDRVDEIGGINLIWF